MEKEYFDVFYGQVNQVNLQSWDVCKKRIIMTIPSIVKNKHIKRHLRDTAKENQIDHYRVKMGFNGSDFAHNNFTIVMWEL